MMENNNFAVGQSCPACGAPVAPGEKFCQNCGTKLPRLHPQHPSLKLLLLKLLLLRLLLLKLLLLRLLLLKLLLLRLLLLRLLLLSLLLLRLLSISRLQLPYRPLHLCIRRP